MNNNQILAVWGSPSSGKTTTAVKIAKELEAMKYSVALVLCEDEIPMLPILLPNGKQNHPSIGELLSQQRISQAEILKYSVPYGSNGNINLLGYRIDDNETTYLEYSATKAKTLFISLSRLVDYIVIDCSPHLMSNGLTILALEAADATLRVVNANLKSSMYIRSQHQLLSDTRFHYDRQIVVMNNVLPGQDDSSHANVFGNVSYTLPHSPSLAEQFETGKLTESMFGREAKKYEPIIREIVKEVFEN